MDDLDPYMSPAKIGSWNKLPVREFTCEWCKKTFTTRRRHTAGFCSRSCGAQNSTAKGTRYLIQKGQKLRKGEKAHKKTNISG